jgi:Domain of unknown function (DUF6398)
MEKQQIQEKQEQILGLIKQFCSAKLNDEYYEISERLVKKLGRKRNVPFMTGQLEIWAVAVIHTVGAVNFLFDKASEPYASLDDINNFFGTKKTTTSGKSKVIRDLLKIKQFDNEFATKDMKASNPYNNYIMVNGYFTPISALPEHLQEVARKLKEK